MIKYDNLEKYFTRPKQLSPFYNYKKVPRKLKKKYKNIFQDKLLNINQQLWCILELTNPNYKRFLIKKLTEDELKKNYKSRL
jgi:hypothetical protein